MAMVAGVVFHPSTVEAYERVEFRRLRGSARTIAGA
jgi:hypothetical protein